MPRKSFLAMGLAIASLPTPAVAVDSGMFLCRSPVVANDFWNDLNTVAGTGVQLTFEIAASIARTHQCEFIASQSLKPIDFVSGQLAITDGNVTGWASPYLYIIYVNRP